MLVYTETKKDWLQKNLSIVRLAAGWTAAHLADEIGVTPQTISNLENKKATMSKSQFYAICAILGNEVERNSDNAVLKQVMGLFLNSDSMSKEEQTKAEIILTYITGAKECRMQPDALSAGLMELAKALDAVKKQLISPTELAQALSPLLNALESVKQEAEYVESN